MFQYIKFILLTCSILMLTACAQTKKPVTTYPHSNIEIKYAIRHFEADVVQSIEKFKNGYLSQEQIESAAKKRFIYLLKENNLLASDTDVNVVDLDIFIDYERRFVGDATPFPMEKLVPPIISLHEASYLGDIAIRKSITTGLTLKDKFGGLLTEKRELEIATVNAIANMLFKRLKKVNQYDRNAFAAMTAGMTEKQIEQKRRYTPLQTPTKAKPPGLTSEQYIPQDRIQQYLTQLNEGNREERLNLYKKLIEEWINSYSLYDKINTIVLNNHESTNSDTIEEVIWATKALAYSGLERYRSTLNTIMKSNASDKLKGYVEDYLEAMTVRAKQAKVVHDTSTMYPNLDWQTNQLLNMLNSSDDDLRGSAVRNIYRQHLNNTRLLDEISEILSIEATIPRNRYMKFSDFYAWGCRVLGSSGNIKYKALLEDLSKNGHTPKVRKFAEKFADEL
ncbi:hypothetical protein [Flocculibacter collagenilyticus]|uniref:hypothetical protein n=1 Tax=Flocculibacter collagenilyticus TaxID=2744479 RepID=UPI0018F61361|nr:hypothetical protein [Flocculibacter collagenilyticus]